MRWSGLLGWLGCIAIIFGLLSLLLQFFSGAIFIARDLPWIWANFGIGIVLLVVALVVNGEKIRERLGSGGAKRAGKYGAGALLSTVLAILLLSLLAFLSTQYHLRWDWTETKLHSLSDQTLKVLAGLEEDVEVTAFYTTVNQPRVKDLLERYRYESERFKVEFVDPEANPTRSRSLGIDDAKLAEGLLHIVKGEESTEVDETDEESVTNALVRLERVETKKIYFLEGHGERALSGQAGDINQGLGQLVDSLRNESYEVEALLLATRADVPEDGKVVVIAGATRPLLEGEHAALLRYVKKGGALLVLIDPETGADLSDALRSWGVLVGDDIVVDRVQGLFGRPVSPFAAEYADHPITQGLREASLFHMARSVQTVDGDQEGFKVLVRTSDKSWGERDLKTFFEEGRAELGDDDLEGPVPVAIAGVIETKDSKNVGEESDGDEKVANARIVVFGDSDFATNQLVSQFRNRDLLVNSVNWLMGDFEAISVRPNRARASRLTLSVSQFVQIRMLSLFVLPELIAALGVVVWWWRRRETLG